MESMKDSFGREIDYMRVSITDRCNLRCRYCMPEGIRLAPVKEILTFEEIEQILRAAAELGIRRFKITGGEPLVRLGCPGLIGRIKRLPGVEQVTLTTNGILLDRYLDELLENGLDAVNISLDTLDETLYKEITGYGELKRVRENLLKAAEKGVPVKVNSVLQKGVHEQQWIELAGLARERKVDVRFIEMMPIGYGKEYKGACGGRVYEMLRRKYPGIKRDSSVRGNGPAVYYRIPGFTGSIGFISAVHDRFCSTCNRIRLTAKGELKPCLCYGAGADVKAALRESGSEAEAAEKIKDTIQKAVERKPQMHCFDAEEKITEERQMVQIGG